jgi:glycosyltransferase involved in cell wall biosynthesis
VSSDGTPRHERIGSGPKRRMLILDSAYTYDALITRNIATNVTGRDLDGYFDHVWTCHPVASLLLPEHSPDRFGRPVIYPLASKHTVVEGRIGRFRALARFPLLNFALAQLDLLRLLFRIVGQEHVGIVRSEDPLYNGALALIIARLKHLPLAVGVWGNPAVIRKTTGLPLMPRLFKTKGIEERVERFVLRRSDLVMVQNEDNRSFVLSAGVRREKTAIFRLGNLLHADHFVDPAERASGRRDLVALGVGDEPTLLVISRLEKVKLVDDVIKAVAQLKHRGRKVVAIFVGDGTFRAPMAELAHTLGVSDQIILCGNRDQPWLARVIPAVSVVVSPLTGRALGEAALGGAPIVAYDVDWQPEVIRPGETGELVPVGDVTAMAAAIERLLADPVHARRLGLNLREEMAELMDTEVLNRTQREIYESLLSRESLKAATQGDCPDGDLRVPR